MKLDYINGNKFLDMAHFAIDFDHRDLTMDLYKQNAIVYCKTDFLDLFFDWIKLSRRKYILISHMSDYPINAERFSRAPDTIVKWFAQNAIFQSEKLVPVPLGLENHKGRSKGKFTNHEWFTQNVPRLIMKARDPQWIYCNWNPNTNQEARGNIIPQLEKNGLKVHHETGLSFEDYCENMSSYKFVICPPGNGVDTHRLWEALYMGCIPIVLRHHIYDGYKLPIIQVNSWSEVTYDLIMPILEAKFTAEHMMFTYWKNRIKHEFKQLN